MVFKNIYKKNQLLEKMKFKENQGMKIKGQTFFSYI